MFEDIKLNIYKKRAIGFAYEFFIPKNDNYGIQTYLVIKKRDYYSFVKYKTHTDTYSNNMKVVFNNMINQGYQPLSYWIELNSTITNNKQFVKKK